MSGDLKIVEYRALPRGLILKTTVDGTFGMAGTTKDGNMEVKTDAKGPLTGEETVEPKG